MAFTTDAGGLAVKAHIKVSTQGSTWNTRLTQLLIRNAEITICTFSLPKRGDFLTKLFDKRSKGVTLIVNSKFRTEATALKARYPDLRIFLSPDTHAKLALAAPDKVWLSSENLVRSPNFENTVGIHNVEVYEFYMEQLMRSGLLAPERELVAAATASGHYFERGGTKWLNTKTLIP
ncbi:phospholipase D family protein [Eubacteriales bacterium OttesenSCG-928-N13]|nr:phospholipase D family protein [Eubacteriales bacterium OttesenSCG-928-N13]